MMKKHKLNEYIQIQYTSYKILICCHFRLVDSNPWKTAAKQLKILNSRHSLKEEFKGERGTSSENPCAKYKTLQDLSARKERGKRGERPLSQCNGNDPINLDSRVFYQPSYKWSPPIGHIVACQTQAGTALYFYSSIAALQDIRN